MKTVFTCKAISKRATPATNSYRTDQSPFHSILLGQTPKCRHLQSSRNQCFNRNRGKLTTLTSRQRKATFLNRNASTLNKNKSSTTYRPSKYWSWKSITAAAFRSAITFTTPQPGSMSKSASLQNPKPWMTLRSTSKCILGSRSQSRLLSAPKYSKMNPRTKLRSLCRCLSKTFWGIGCLTRWRRKLGEFDKRTTRTALTTRFKMSSGSWTHFRWGTSRDKKAFRPSSCRCKAPWLPHSN